MKKRLVLITSLIVIMIASCFAFIACENNSATPQTSESVGLKYLLVNEQTEYEVVSVGECTDTNLIIPSTFNGKPVTSIGEYAFYNCTFIEELVIPNSIKNIGLNAFKDCSSLKYNEKDGLNYLGNSENKYLYLAGVVNLNVRSVTVDSGCKFIGDNAFSGCSLLTDIVVPDNVKSFGEEVFYNCRNLEEMTLPFVGARAGVTLNDNLQHPFGYLFGSLEYDGSVETIQSHLKHGEMITNSYYIPFSLTEVTITGGEILAGAFSNCAHLSSVKLLEGVNAISLEAFAYCEQLKSVEIPDSVTSIGQFAFVGCNSLEEISIPNGVTSIYKSSFAYCTSLTSVVIPDSVTWIGDAIFAYCSALESVKIGDGVDKITPAMFAYCSSLKEVQLGYKVESIGYSAFAFCTSLEKIVLSDRIATLGAYAFSGCSSLLAITLPKNLTNVSVGLFSLCSSLKTVELQYNVEFIESEAFFGCSSLTSVTLPNNIKKIYKNAFGFCSSLESIIIPDSVVYMGKGVFADCSALTIYCDMVSLPSAWDIAWNSSNCAVVWKEN